ncbi:MAG: hypothetical protein RIS70_342 [Planctomycetota bacterium]|jgi:hypothetical protein
MISKTRQRLPTWFLASLLGVTMVGLNGCSSRKVADYVPSESAAREALVKALDEWKQGKPAGTIEGKPAIQVGDSLRTPGQILESYEILGELPEDGGRRFTVQVKLSNPAVEEKLYYIVLGIDPLWVMRREDYNMIGHWEHKMSEGGE